MGKTEVKEQGYDLPLAGKPFETLTTLPFAFKLGQFITPKSRHYGKPGQHVIGLQQMGALLFGLDKERTALSNQLESFTNSGCWTSSLKGLSLRNLGISKG